MNASLGQERPAEISCACRVILLILCAAPGKMTFAEEGNSRSNTSQSIAASLTDSLSQLVEAPSGLI